MQVFAGLGLLEFLEFGVCCTCTNMNLSPLHTGRELIFISAGERKLVRAGRRGKQAGMDGICFQGRLPSPRGWWGETSLFAQGLCLLQEWRWLSNIWFSCVLQALDHGKRGGRWLSASSPGQGINTAQYGVQPVVCAFSRRTWGEKMMFKENYCIAYQLKTKVFCPVNHREALSCQSLENASLALLPGFAQSGFLLQSNKQVLGAVAFNEKNR